MNSTLFVHVPKSGGTTLDSVLADNADPATSLHGFSYLAQAKHWDSLDDPGHTLVSGHIPAGALDITRFDQRITILREPLSMLASLTSYIDQQSPQTHHLRAFAEQGRPYPAYEPYFTPRFDRLRMSTEVRYGIAGPEHLYGEHCTVSEALHTLSSFERVLDFAQLDGEVKRLIIELGLFPPSNIPRARAYQYTPDLDLARRLLTDFDAKFYERARRQFRPLSADVDASYEKYRIGYAREHGLQIAMNATSDVSLRAPIGSGWLVADRSDLGMWFRWANMPSPTVDIPVRGTGTYTLHAYVHPHRMSGIHAELSSLVGGHRQRVTVEERPGVTVLHAQVHIENADWIQLRIGAESVAAAPDAGHHFHFVLGRMLLRRSAAASTAIKAPRSQNLPAANARRAPA
jgi:hypothetical protein